ncbi:MAG: hypothetical protein ACPHRO_14185, partial [Nannocystaceae bacterium]
CNQIVEEFGGALSLRTSSPDGTVFEIKLPLGVSPEQSIDSGSGVRRLAAAGITGPVVRG